MNKVNDVFITIKRHAAKQARLAELHRFDIIARDARVTEANLDEYLKRLEQQGLIRYSKEEGFIYLTSRGRMEEKCN